MKFILLSVYFSSYFPIMVTMNNPNGVKNMKKILIKINKNHFLLKITIMMASLAIFFITSIYMISFLLGPPEIISERNTIYYDQDETIIGEEKGIESRY